MLLGARVRLISVPWHSPPSAAHLTRAGQLHTHCWGVTPLHPTAPGLSAADLGWLCPQKNPESLAVHPSPPAGPALGPRQPGRF